MAVNLSLDATKVKKETDISGEELILLKGGRPAFFAIKRIDPELASTSPKSPEPEEHIYIYQHCKTVCSRLLRLLDSLTPELVTYSYMSHWADREQCQWRVEILNRAKDKLRSIIIYAEEMFQVIEQSRLLAHCSATFLFLLLIKSPGVWTTFLMKTSRSFKQLNVQVRLSREFSATFVSAAS